MHGVYQLAGHREFVRLQLATGQQVMEGAIQDAASKIVLAKPGAMRGVLGLCGDGPFEVVDGAFVELSSLSGQSKPDP
jgi:hypothetical protein